MSVLSIYIVVLAPGSPANIGTSTATGGIGETSEILNNPYDFEVGGVIVGGLTSEVGSNTILMAEGNNTRNNVVDVDLDLDDDEVDKSNEEPTVMFNDNLSIQEETNVSPLDSDDQSLIIPLTSEDESEAGNGSSIMDPNFNSGGGDFDLAGVFDLATIEEQPELGYSSESESNTSTTPQLDSLLEQEETNN